MRSYLQGIGVNGGTLTLVYTNGDEIKMELNLPGSGLFNVVLATTGSDSLLKMNAQRAMRLKAGEQQGFMEIISGFFREAYHTSNSPAA